MTAAEIEHLRRLPKAELHLHLEGCIRPALLAELARRHGFPHGIRTLADAEALYTFGDFAGFIHAIKTASQHLVEPADYAATVTAMARDLAAQGVVYAEVFLSIGILLWRQVPVEPYWEAVEAARVTAETETGVRIRWIFDAVRQFGAEHLERVVDWAIRLQPAGSVLAIGIGGDEQRGPAAWFADGYARARAAGLRTTAHAGESAGPESVRDALRLLKADRIGHGLRAIEDPELMRELAHAGVPLDICPTSNLKTGSCPDLATHPVRQFFDAGIPLAISTDDPGIFNCTLLGEFDRLHTACGFTLPELESLATAARQFTFPSR